MTIRASWAARFVLVAALAAGPAALAATPMVSAGQFHSLALKADGTVLAWGLDSYGQLGLGRTVVTPSPTRIEGVPGIASVSTGCNHTLALATDGTVWSWGTNTFGQLGDGTTDDRPLPDRVPGLSGVKMVGAGCNFSVAMLRDGTLVTWGYNGQGALGNGGTTSRSTPGPVSRGNVYRTMTVSLNAVFAIDEHGLLWWWGFACAPSNTCSTTTGANPLPTPSYEGVTAIATGADFAVAIMTDGTVRAWGNTAYGVLGWDPRVGRPPGSPPGPPYPIQGLANVVAIAAGSNHALALRSDGTVWAWGRNETGQLGDGAPQLLRATAQPVPGLANVTAIAAGSMHSVARKADGTMWTWGNNLGGELGDGTQVQRNSPVAVPGVSGVAFIAASTTQSSPFAAAVNSVTFAARADGSLWGWGANTYGQLGTAEDLWHNVPSRIPNLSGISMVSAGATHSAAVGSDGSLWTWGGNVNGALGDGSNVGRSTPAPVPGFTNATFVLATSGFTLATKSDGTLWFWGAGTSRPSGRGADVFSPIQVAGVSGAASVSTSGLVLRQDGGLTLVTLGGTTAPTLVLGLSNIVAVSGSYALRNDGTLWSVTSSGVVQVPGLSNVAAIFGTQWIVLRDGTVLARGSNDKGQLGDGTTNGRTTLSPVPALSGIESISPGSQHALALTRDHRVIAWGHNRYGMLGDGTLATRLRPVAVLAEDGGGSLAGNDWYLALDATRPAIPPDLVPAMLARVSGDVTSTLSVNVRFRAADIGRPIRVFAFAPASLTKSSLAKDDACVLAQLGPTGLQQVTAANLASTGNVLGSAAQAVAVLNSVSASQVAGSTFCVGTGGSGSTSADPANYQCVATVPGPSLCVGPSSGTAGANVPGPVSGLWWNAAESGWGVHFTQRRDVVFAAWYTYDGAGGPKWYVASDCRMASASAAGSGTCSGSLYEVKGPAFFGASFNPSAVNVTPAGSLQVDFASPDSATMSYTAGTLSRSLAINRQPIATGSPPGVDYTDLWWNPSESGWGLAISQQAATLFLAWYVYDGTGNPVWYVASSCVLSGSSCTGTLYRTTGPPLGPSFNPSQVQVIPAGTITVSFTDGNNGAISYTVNGVTGSKVITRQAF